MTDFINLFLILTLTHLEPERRLASVTTSKLDAGVPQTYGFGGKKKHRVIRSAFCSGGSGQFSQDGAGSHAGRIRTGKKKESCELMERMTKR